MSFVALQERLVIAEHADDLTSGLRKSVMIQTTTERRRMNRRFKQNNGFKPMKAATGFGRISGLRTPNSMTFNRVHRDRREFDLVSPPVWSPTRVGPPLLIPINGGSIWITSPYGEQSDSNPNQNCHKIPKLARSSPPVWNPVRVGPPLLIPLNGGSILIT